MPVGDYPLVEAMRLFHCHAPANSVQRIGLIQIKHRLCGRKRIVQFHLFGSVWRCGVAVKINDWLVAGNERHGSVVVDQYDLEPLAVEEKACARRDRHHLMKDVPCASEVVEQALTLRYGLEHPLGT